MWKNATDGVIEAGKEVKESEDGEASEDKRTEQTEGSQDNEARENQRQRRQDIIQDERGRNAKQRKGDEKATEDAKAESRRIILSIG